MAYGTAAQVAALTRRYTHTGTYDTTTNPALATVTDWLATISADLDTYLAAAGFTVPVTQATCVISLAGVAVEKTADLAHTANSAGRFFTDRALERGTTPMMTIRREIREWVEQNTAGFIALGAAHSATDNRANTITSGVISLDIAEHEDGTSTVDA